MKAATFWVTLEKLGITAVVQTPRVSNDNPYSESVFRTLKYRPAFPVNGFAGLKAAREYVYGFVDWYNQAASPQCHPARHTHPTACG